MNGKAQANQTLAKGKASSESNSPGTASSCSVGAKPGSPNGGHPENSHGRPQEVYSEEWQWAEFNSGNVTLALNSGVKLPDVIAGGRIALAVDDVFAASAALEAQGVRFTIEPTDYTVCHAAAILDPDGNPVILHKQADGSFG